MKISAVAGKRARVLTPTITEIPILQMLIIAVLANANISGIHPFGLAVFASIMPNLAGVIAMSLGALLLGLGAIRYIACVLIFYGVGYFKKLDRVSACLILGVDAFLCGMGEMMFSTPSVYSALCALAEGACCMVLMYLFCSLKSFRPDTVGTREQQAAAIIIIGAIINSFSGISVAPNVEVNILLGLLSLMLLVNSVGVCKAVTAGMVIGILSTIGTDKLPAVIGVYAASALFSALLSGMGKWGIILGFLCGSAMCIMCGESFYNARIYLYAMLLAAVIFALVPDFLRDAICSKVSMFASGTNLADEYTRLGKRMKEITRENSAISIGIKRINDELAKNEETKCEALYSVKTVKKERAAKGVSGDYVLEFDTESDMHYLLLCDGMGSGKRANRESKMTAELLREFLQTGFLKDKALNILNSAIAIKGEEESFSTVDLVEINLKNGDCEILKIGSADTFIKHKDELETISAKNLPIGILEDVKPNTTVKRLSAGDMIVLVSDGVCEAGYGVLKGEWIKRMIKNANSDAEALAEDILAEAQRRANPDKDDDMTVAVIRVERKKR